MSSYRLKLDEPTPRLFPKYGELANGAVVEVDGDEPPGDGITWKWVKAGNANPDVAEPVVPDTAEGVSQPEPEADEKSRKASRKH